MITENLLIPARLGRSAMFDATLNGVMDSADVGSDIILADLLQRRRSLQTNRTGEFNGERWSDPASTEEAMEHCFPADALADMVSIAGD